MLRSTKPLDTGSNPVGGAIVLAYLPEGRERLSALGYADARLRNVSGEDVDRSEPDSFGGSLGPSIQKSQASELELL